MVKETNQITLVYISHVWIAWLEARDKVLFSL